jgi:DnaJ-class molecular chaperone
LHRDNGTTVDSETGKGFWGNHGYRHVQGPCWTCQGAGVFQKTGKPCRKCAGSGTYSKFRRWSASENDPHTPLPQLCVRSSTHQSPQGAPV